MPFGFDGAIMNGSYGLMNGLVKALGKGAGKAAVGVVKLSVAGINALAEDETENEIDDLSPQEYARLARAINESDDKAFAAYLDSLQ